MNAALPANRNELRNALVEGHRVKRQLHAKGRDQSGRKQRCEGKQATRADKNPQRTFDQGPQRAEHPEGRHRDVHVAPRIGRSERRDREHACAGDHRDRHRQSRGVGDPRRAEACELAIDQRRQCNVIRRQSEKCRNSEIADTRDEDKQRRHGQMRAQQRQEDLAQDGRRRCAIELRRFDETSRDGAQSGCERDRGERRMMQGKNENDSKAAEQGIGRARWWREPDRIQERRSRPGQSLVRECCDLRRDQKRHHIKKGENALAADVRHGDGDGEAGAERKRADARCDPGFDRVPGRDQRHTARRSGEGRGRIDLSVRRQRRDQKTDKGQRGEKGDANEKNGDEAVALASNPIHPRTRRSHHGPKMSTNRLM